MADFTRKEKILSAVVDSYISDGEPVGSRALQECLDLNVSSATIRNELAYLEKEGYLIQPHTSAGRIPTQLGYRYYIDNLMEREKLSERAKDYINQELLKKATSPEDVLKQATQLLSELTGLVAIATTPPSEDARIHKLRFVQTGRQTGMAVLITSTGIIKNMLFRTDFVLTSKMLSVFERALNERMEGIPLSDVTMAFIQTTAVSFGELSLFMPNILLAIEECCREAQKTTVFLAGQTKLLYYQDYDLLSARNVLKFLNNKNDISSLLLKKGYGTGTYIGTESGQPELFSAGVIVSRYNLNGVSAGAISTVGPIRISYNKTISCTEYVSKKSGDIISQLLETA